MGTISKREAGTYQAQTCINGKRRTKTFKKLAEAKRWLAQCELVADQGLSPGAQNPVRVHLSTYRDLIAPKRRQPRHEVSVINVMVNDPLGDVPTCEVKEADILAWMERKRTIPSACTGRIVQESSIDRMLNTLSSFFTWCKKQGYIKANPVAGIERPKENPHRERIATNEEIERLKHVAGWEEGQVPYNFTQRVCAAFVLSCLTGMRAGEMLMIERSWIDGDVLHIPAAATKTKAGRTIALNKRARRIIEDIASMGFTPRIFCMETWTRDALWRKIRDKAGLHEERDSEGRVVRQGLNFHDGRATFCTWAASPGADGAPRMDVLSLARQTGHKNLKMLMRYYRPDISSFVSRLDS